MEASAIDDLISDFKSKINIDKENYKFSVQQRNIERKKRRRESEDDDQVSTDEDEDPEDDNNIKLTDQEKSIFEDTLKLNA